jgi:hypothetical protein
MRITTWEIKKRIRKLRKEAAAGPDEIGPRLLQELEEEVVVALQQIFIKSLASGDVPADWRRANVTPIFKKGAMPTRVTTDRSHSPLFRANFLRRWYATP